MREEFLVACGADVDAFDRLDACVAQNTFGDCPEIQVPSPYGSGAEAGSKP